MSNNQKSLLPAVDLDELGAPVGVVELAQHLDDALLGLGLLEQHVVLLLGVHKLVVLPAPLDRDPVPRGHPQHRVQQRLLHVSVYQVPHQLVPLLFGDDREGSAPVVPVGLAGLEFQRQQEDVDVVVAPEDVLVRVDEGGGEVGADGVHAVAREEVCPHDVIETVHAALQRQLALTLEEQILALHSLLLLYPLNTPALHTHPPPSYPSIPMPSPPVASLLGLIPAGNKNGAASDDEGVLPAQFLPLLLGDDLSRGLVEGQGAWRFGGVLVLEPAAPALALCALLAHADDLLDLRVATEEGVVDDLGEVGLEAGPALVDELGTAVGLGPEVGLGEGRELRLRDVELLERLVDVLELLEAVPADIVLVVRQVPQVHLVQHHSLLHRVGWDPQQVELVRTAEVVVPQHVLLPHVHHKILPSVILLNGKAQGVWEVGGFKGRAFKGRAGGEYIINMIGLLSIVLFVHAGLSTQRWRTFVQVNQEPFFLPIDIALEIALATLLALLAILANTSKFKALRQFTQPVSYDASFFKPNFKNYRTSRAALLLPYLKERLGSEDLTLNFKL